MQLCSLQHRHEKLPASGGMRSMHSEYLHYTYMTISDQRHFLVAVPPLPFDRWLGGQNKPNPRSLCCATCGLVAVITELTRFSHTSRCAVHTYIFSFVKCLEQ